MDRAETQDELYQKAAQEYGAVLARMAYAYEADPDLRMLYAPKLSTRLKRKR